MSTLLADVAVLADIGLRSDECAANLREMEVRLKRKIQQLNELASTIGVGTTVTLDSSIAKVADHFDAQGTDVLRRAALVAMAERGRFSSDTKWDDIDANFARVTNIPLDKISAALHDRFARSSGMKFHVEKKGTVRIETDDFVETYKPGFQTGMYPAYCSLSMQNTSKEYDENRASPIKERLAWLQKVKVTPDVVLGHEEHEFEHSAVHAGNNHFLTHVPHAEAPHSPAAQHDHSPSHTRTVSATPHESIHNSDHESFHPTPVVHSSPTEHTTHHVPSVSPISSPSEPVPPHDSHLHTPTITPEAPAPEHVHPPAIPRPDNTPIPHHDHDPQPPCNEVSRPSTPHSHDNEVLTPSQPPTEPTDSHNHTPTTPSEPAEMHQHMPTTPTESTNITVPTQPSNLAPHSHSRVNPAQVISSPSEAPSHNHSSENLSPSAPLSEPTAQTHTHDHLHMASNAPAETHSSHEVHSADPLHQQSDSNSSSLTTDQNIESTAQDHSEHSSSATPHNHETPTGQFASGAESDSAPSDTSGNNSGLQLSTPEVFVGMLAISTIAFACGTWTHKAISDRSIRLATTPLHGEATSENKKKVRQ